MSMQLDDLEVYRLAMDIGERIWQTVDAWDWFAKDTVGRQLVKAADSLAATISEGYGRFHYKENKQFCYYARGSLSETKTWLCKAHSRGFVDTPTYEALEDALTNLGIRLNNSIRSIGTGPTGVYEDAAEYGDPHAH